MDSGRNLPSLCGAWLRLAPGDTALLRDERAYQRVARTHAENDMVSYDTAYVYGGSMTNVIGQNGLLDATFNPEAFNGVNRFPHACLTLPVLGEAQRIPEAFEQWDRWMTPIDDQGKRGTCVAQATSRIIEWAIWYHLGARVQLDAERLYRAAWCWQNKAEWPGDAAYQDGLQMQSAYYAAVNEGIIGGASQLINVPLASVEFYNALSFGPLLAGTCVTRAWQTPQPDTGEILRANIEMNGHAWVIHGLGVSNEPSGGTLVRGCNSWGTGWGYHGFFQIHFAHFVQCALCSPMIIKDDWERTLMTRTWEGWVLP